MKLLIDTLGADKGYEVIVKGTLNNMLKNEIEVVFIGEEEKIKKIVENTQVDKNRIGYINTSEYIENTEEPTLAIRRKKEASIPLGLRNLNEDEFDGFLSCGSTGALLAGATLITKRLPNISRAALTVVIPTLKGASVLLDGGANMDCPPDMLRQFALMGSAYAKGVLEKNNPKVALLNVGTEEGKGDALRKETFKLLKECPINFVGNMEARDLLYGEQDVIVADGFSGNVALKATEGAAMVILNSLKDGILSSLKSKIGGLLIKDSLKNLKNTFDYKEYGAAPLLGVKKPVFKAHGSSDERAIEAGINKMVKFIDNDVISDIKKYFEEEN
ncbi:MAG: phosphate acyltransferase PlsX [Tissierellia bacterium]|nr:phosphate acyltransferase PlsX [Tissierellia bacterium]